MSKIRKDIVILIISVLIILGILTYVASYYVADALFITSQELIREPNTP